jgi:hypothetical protein
MRMNKAVKMKQATSNYATLLSSLDYPPEDDVADSIFSEAKTNHSLNGANTTTELCPPNPNELEMAAFKRQQTFLR